ncbi:hypothetical protein BDV10DRAFT_168733 [Aspergillus recurvatus]
MVRCHARSPVRCLTAGSLFGLIELLLYILSNFYLVPCPSQVYDVNEGHSGTVTFKPRTTNCSAWMRHLLRPLASLGESPLPLKMVFHACIHGFANWAAVGG